MCNFLSGIVLRNGDVLTHPLLDSHSDLIRHFQLPDAHAHHQHFAKVELTPVDWLDVDTWRWRLDEETIPGWWDDVTGQAESTLRERAKRMIITTGVRELILDGCWIVGGDALMADVCGGRLAHVRGGTISHVRGGTISDVRGGTISHVYGGTISDVSGGAISDVRGGAISHVYGGAISHVYGGAISHVRGGTLDESAKTRVAVTPESRS